MQCSLSKVISGEEKFKLFNTNDRGLWSTNIDIGDIMREVEIIY